MSIIMLLMQHYSRDRSQCKGARNLIKDSSIRRKETKMSFVDDITVYINKSKINN